MMKRNQAWSLGLFLGSTLILVAFQNCGGGIKFTPVNDPIVNKIDQVGADGTLEILPPGSQTPPISGTGTDGSSGSPSDGSTGGSVNPDGQTESGHQAGSSGPGDGSSGGSVNPDGQTDGGHQAGSGGNGTEGEENLTSTETETETETEAGPGNVGSQPPTQPPTVRPPTNPSLSICGEIRATSLTLNVKNLMILGNGGAVQAHAIGSISLSLSGETTISVQVDEAVNAKEARLVLEADGNFLVDSSNKSFPLKVPSGDSSGLKVKLQGHSNLQPGTSYSLKVSFDGGDIHAAGGRCMLSPVIQGTLD